MGVTESGLSYNLENDFLVSAGVQDAGKRVSKLL